MDHFWTLPVLLSVFFIAGTFGKCDSNQCSNEMDATSLTVFSTTNIKNGSELTDNPFIHAQLLKELLLSVKFDEQTSRKEFIHFFKENAALSDSTELIGHGKFEREYTKHSAIWWYTVPGFIHETLNDALRTQDVINLLRSGFFIQKLHRQLEHMSVNSDSMSGTFVLHCGQGLSYEDYAKLKKITNGEFVSFNTFLSVNTDRELAMRSAQRAIRDGFETSVLFSITIEASTTASIPFACVDDLSYFENLENQYMFSINTIFRIQEVQKLAGKGGVLHVKLQPISTRDKSIRQLMEPTRKEIKGSTSMFQLAKLMILMNQNLTAEIIYKRLLDETTLDDLIDIEFIHYQLASIQEKVNNISGALTLYERTLEMSTSHRPANDSFVLTILMRIANILGKQKQYDTAFEKYQEALRLDLQASEPNYRRRSKLYNDIGTLLASQERYAESLEYHTQSVALDLEHSPNDHINIAISYNNIASNYKEMKDYELALTFFQKALIHHQQMSPIQMATIYQDHFFIALMLKELGRLDEALAHTSEAAKIIVQMYSDDDPNRRIHMDVLEKFLIEND